MSKTTQPVRSKAVSGRCCICGCTYEDPCPEGCSWADANQTLCTNPICLAVYKRETRLLAAIDRVLKHHRRPGGVNHGRGSCVPFGALNLLIRRRKEF